MNKARFVSAIIVSAGNSTRMGGINKQFLELCGMSVISRSIKAFQNCESINEIIIVTRNCDIDFVKGLVKECGYSKVSAIVEGGSTRNESVCNGIAACSPNTDYFAIHDGARPLVTQKVICDTLECALICGAATAGVKLKDTIKVVNNSGEIAGTTDRETLRAVQTPQIFSKDVYLNALENVPDSKNFTDDCMLIEANGGKVMLCEGDYENIKITTPEDIELAEIYLSKREK